MEQENRTALITGATGGLGFELARRFANDNYSLVLVGRDEQKLQAAARDLLGEFGTKVQIIVEDLSTEGAADRVAAEVEARGIQVDALVNDAGFGYGERFIDSDEQRQKDLLQVNVATLTELCRKFAPGMVERHSGAILNVASIAGFMGGPFLSTYYASKAYVQTFTQALHAELRTSGVHVTALCPGPVRTPFWKNADADKTLLAHLTARPQSVARAAYRALRVNKTLCIPGIFPKIVVFLTRLVPRSWMAYCSGAMQYPGPRKKDKGGDSMEEELQDQGQGQEQPGQTGQMERTDA